MVRTDWMGLQPILEGLLEIFVYTPDIERFGVHEYWASPDESIGDDGKLRGDCDDFALAAWRRATEAGYRPRLIECILPDGRHHMVCEVDGSIIDNRFRTIMYREELINHGYQFVKMSGYSQDDTWTEIDTHNHALKEN